MTEDSHDFSREEDAQIYPFVILLIRHRHGLTPNLSHSFVVFTSADRRRPNIRPIISHHSFKYQVALKTSSDLRKTIGFYACDDILRLPLIFQFIFFISAEHFAYKYIHTQSFRRPISRNNTSSLRRTSHSPQNSPFTIYVTFYYTTDTLKLFYSSGTKSPNTDMSESSASDESSTSTTSETADPPERASRTSNSPCHIAIERASEARVPSATAMRYRSSDAMPCATTGERRDESDRAGTAEERGREGARTVRVVIGRRWTGLRVRTARHHDELTSQQ